MKEIREAKKNNGHFHAWSLYEKLSLKHYILLLSSIIFAKIAGYKSVTAHLPLELQHKKFKNIKEGKAFVYFGELWKRVLGVKLYWENAPLLNFGAWTLKSGQTDWSLIPGDIEICLDPGHLMLGAKSVRQARRRILDIIKKRGLQIRHLHIHENNLTADIHQKPKKIITPHLMKILTLGRTYIFEC